MNDIDLDLAIKDRVITPETAQKLRNLSARRDGISHASREGQAWLSLPDVVLALAVVAMVAGITTVGTIIAHNPAVAFIITMVTAWLIGEYLRARPGYAISRAVAALLWTMGMAGTYFYILAATLLPTDTDFARMKPADLPPELIMLCGTGMILAIGLHFWRFAIPILVLPFVFTLGSVAGSLVLIVAPSFHTVAVPIIALILGIVSMLVAGWLDMSDIRRETPRSTLAFWGHLAAMYMFATTMAHGAILMLENEDRFATVGLPFALVFFGIALLLDRRAYLFLAIPALFLSIASLLTLAGMLGYGIALLICGTLTVVACFVWQRWRKRLLHPLPIAVRAQLPRTDLEIRTVRTYV